MTPGGLPTVHRRAARVLLLDGDGRILLLQGRDPGRPDGPAWWFTPGGGIHPSEDPRAALRRECWEELGRIPSELIGPIAGRVYEFPFDGRWLIQDTTYFWAAVAAFDPAPQRLTELEQRFILGWRWWRLGDIPTTAETIYPEDLLGILGAITA